MTRRLWIDTTGEPVITTTPNGVRNATRWGWTPAVAVPDEQDDREPSDAEVEAAAKAAYDRAFLKHAPEEVDRWDDLVADNNVAARSWRDVARMALLAAQEVRRDS